METGKGLLWEGFGNGHGFNSVHFKLYLAHFSVNCLGNSKHRRLGMVPWATMKPWINDLPCSGNMTGNCFENRMDSPFEWPNTPLNLSHIQIRVCRVECNRSNFLLKWLWNGILRTVWPQTLENKNMCLNLGTIHFRLFDAFLNHVWPRVQRNIETFGGDPGDSWG